MLTFVPGSLFNPPVNASDEAWWTWQGAELKVKRQTTEELQWWRVQRGEKRTRTPQRHAETTLRATLEEGWRSEGLKTGSPTAVLLWARPGPEGGILEPEGLRRTRTFKQCASAPSFMRLHPSLSCFSWAISVRICSCRWHTDAGVSDGHFFSSLKAEQSTVTQRQQPPFPFPPPLSTAWVCLFNYSPSFLPCAYLVCSAGGTVVCVCVCVSVGSKDLLPQHLQLLWSLGF